ncbi:hypothetical protein TWF569_006841 [Orbilia oligospora]|uniref:F-box domain-containing protein n=1 Tax=Orbilia oligospora TaxID=2813651 RepID=A0A7C8NHW6_ORBOL|nr:hypothetical protein TWF102_000796 [Orbilia oligospora]KAF3116570.1 hypothetical protein TWF103_008333 [Orbilia oligospora]KAF3156260.1 hypothetical protein TWF569_006841 [Orbilia oligospora]
MASTPNSIKPLAQENCALHVPEILGGILSYLPFKKLKTDCRAVCGTWKKTVETLPGLKTYTSTGLLASDLRIVGENSTIENPVPQLTEVAKECLGLFCKKATSIIKGHQYWTVKETLSRRRLKSLEKLYRQFTRGFRGYRTIQTPTRGPQSRYLRFYTAVSVPIA